MPATSISIQLTSFIIQISFNNWNSKVLVMGKVAEEYLQTKPYSLSFLFLMCFFFNKKQPTYNLILSCAAKNKNYVDN